MALETRSVYRLKLATKSRSSSGSTMACGIFCLVVGFKIQVLRLFIVCAIEDNWSSEGALQIDKQVVTVDL